MPVAWHTNKETHPLPIHEVALPLHWRAKVKWAKHGFPVDIPASLLGVLLCRCGGKCRGLWFAHRSFLRSQAQNLSLPGMLNPVIRETYWAAVCRLYERSFKQATMFSQTYQPLVQCRHRTTKISTNEHYIMLQKVHSNLFSPTIYEVLNLCLLHDCIHTVFFHCLRKMKNCG